MRAAVTFLRSAQASLAEALICSRTSAVEHARLMPAAMRARFFGSVHAFLVLPPLGILLSPRMELPVNVNHLCRRDVRVNLCRANARVAQELLHASQIGAPVEQVSCERVP